jgi:hypothetical protein
LLALLSACGSPKPQDPAFLPYLQAFHRQYSADILDTEIEFVSMFPTNNELAQCEMGFDHVEVRRDYWEMLSETSRKVLIFHELGHCIFNRIHRNDVYDDNCPKSIMSTYLMSDSCYNAHSQDLLKELPNYIIKNF